jgi:mono/diheme cytochrome c family protein
MRLLAYITFALKALVTFALSTVFLLMPRMNWSATVKPGALENRIASTVRQRRIAIHRPHQRNPVAVTPDNLFSGREDYNEHCSVCHGVDGSEKKQDWAEFYPRVARLTGDAKQLSDAEIYFVIANGVTLSAMPAFGERHRPDEIWKLVIWVRHLAALAPDEPKKIERETSHQERNHEEMMNSLEEMMRRVPSMAN